MDGRIKCELCGKLLLRLDTHLKIHGINLAQYRQKFPCSPVMSSVLCDKMSQSAIRKFEDPIQRKKYCDIQSVRWTDKQRERQREIKRDWWRKHPEEIEKNRVALLEKMRVLWSKEEHRSKMSALAKRRILDPNDKFGKTTWTPIRYKHHNKWLILKSSYELVIAKWLDFNGIDWRYEIQVPYTWMNYEHVYLVDFFLPYVGIFVEVKSNYYYEKYKDLIETKLSAVRDSGKPIYLIKEDNWEIVKDLILSKHYEKRALIQAEADKAGPLLVDFVKILGNILVK